MIDFHTHVLSDIDDGSRDLDESLALLREERNQGVGHIVATPHFYADRATVEQFLQRREESLSRLARAQEEKALPRDKEEGWPQIRTGAEVYFFPGMGRAEKLPNLCVREEDGTLTDLILIEMPFVQWDGLVVQELEDILTEQRLRVVLAHVERYPDFQKDKRFWNQVMEMGQIYPLTLQINGGSFLKGRSRRKFCLRLLEEQRNVILGSDCHNMITRVPNLEEAREVIRRKLDQGRVDLLDRTAAELLE